jgi:hypothetical protein
VVERQRVKERVLSLAIGRACVNEMEDHFFYTRTYSGLTATLNAAEAAAYMNGGRRPTFSEVGVSPEK